MSHGLLIIIDQARADYMDFMPKLKELVKESAYFTNAYLRHLPAQTPVGHATISTGLCPDQHSIIGYEWYDMGRRIELNAHLQKRTDLQNFLRVQTLAEKAKDKDFRAISITGKRCVSVLLSGREIDGFYSLYPERFWDNTWVMWDTDKGDPTRTPTEFGTPLFRKEIKTDRPIADKYQQPEPFDDLVFRAAKEILENYLRHLQKWLLTISFSATDFAGHKFGPKSNRVKNCLYRVDGYIEELQRILQTLGVLNDTYIVISSDHGARTSIGRVKINPQLPESSIRFVKINWASLLAGSKIIHIERDDIEVRPPDHRQIQLLKTIQVAGNDIAYIYLRSRSDANDIINELAKVPYIRFMLGKNHREGLTLDDEGKTEKYVNKLVKSPETRDIIGDIILIPEEGFTIMSPYESYDPPLGSHGACYPIEEILHIPLLIKGPRIHPGPSEDLVYQDQIAPTLVYYLGIECPNNTYQKVIRI